ncbi:MAG: AraC family transcriptional regulator [Phycisphaerales bacterium]|nr:MAG: AraC family transcriptional regulator [Phycisphaerales bacterium]
MSTGKRPTTAADYRQRILRVLVYIQTHLDEAVCLDDLAELACFSPFHFHRIFSGMMGEGVMEHVRRLRLERAAHRLRFDDQPIVRVAFDAGFETHEAFSRAFKAMFGRSPSEFRAARRAADASASQGPPPGDAPAPARRADDDASAAGAAPPTHAPSAHDHRRSPARLTAVDLPPAASGVHYDQRGRVDAFTPLKGDPTVHVRIETLQPQRVAFIRHVGPYEQVGYAWTRLMSWAGPRGLIGAGPPIGLAYDDPQITPPDKLRYDACLPVASSVQGEGDVGVQDVAGGEYAVTEHVGPYERLHYTYTRLFGQWLPGSGRTPRSDPCIERYLNDPRSTPPEQLRTEVCVPVA